MNRAIAYFVALTLVFLPMLGLVGMLSLAWVLPVLLMVAGWLMWGAKIVVHRPAGVPMVAEDRIDVKGALRVLWWVAWWPRYL